MLLRPELDLSVESLELTVSRDLLPVVSSLTKRRYQAPRRQRDQRPSTEKKTLSLWTTMKLKH